MFTETIATEETECFYCSGTIDIGDKVYENEGSFCHTECYEDNEAILEEDDDVDFVTQAQEEEKSEEPDTGEEAEKDVEGPDGGDDD